MGFCCGRRLVSSLVPDESEDEACDEEERPCHVVFSKRQGMHELIHSRSRELQHLQSVIESRNKGESRCQRTDLLASSETLVEECQDDQGNSSGYRKSSTGIAPLMMAERPKRAIRKEKPAKRAAHV